MSEDTPFVVLWRQRWVIVAVVLVFAVSAAIISTSLDKVYAATSTALVTVTAETQTFDSVQASQAFARSYADIAGSPNIAELVARRLGGDIDSDALRKAVTFEAVPETQLLKITAESSTPAQAKRIADAYAAEFGAYARRNLAPRTHAEVTPADAAPLPEHPVRPKPVLYVLVAIILGLAAACTLAFVRDRLDRRLRGAEDVEARIGGDVPVLGRIPYRGRSEASIGAFEEAYRILRKNLEFASAQPPLRSVAVTSAQSGEGKTTTVIHLARASAELGLRVIVLEADFRRPGVPAALAFDGDLQPYPGLSNFLIGTASLDEIIQPTLHPDLAFVAAGPPPPSGSALLESGSAHDVVPELLRRADLLLVDCPPVNAGADASVLAGMVDGVVVVVDLKSSTDRTVSAALRQLRAVRSAVLGLVLNRDRTVPADRHEGQPASPSGQTLASDFIG
jgi:capsular exopolysaccharide synthesis family protein